MKQDRSGRTLEDYRELFWEAEKTIKELEAQVANFQSDAYVLSLLTKLDAVKHIINESSAWGDDLVEELEAAMGELASEPE